ncbi:amidase [Pseudooceanicola nanhaiensis]|uniref:amidase n=1 Tax=Pseudooceanicola nanhaiensis TaxID=375761 RepID=UPI001CD3E007|nr:amidase [Pseudooceanicola nanhaiensis]MCA0919271.1 amidase [Pseudooceanicola nanhaiensis]
MTDTTILFGADDCLHLAEMLRSSSISRRELLEETIRRVETLDETLNAVPIRFFEAAMAEADGPLPDGPFAGVPVMVKDAQTPIKGQEMTQGSNVMKGNVAAADAPLVARMKAAGMTILARSSSAEFGSMFETDTARYGATRNPWNPDHSSGGSSGGASAAVAARMVLAGHAGDGAGSIRVPAGFCGVFGLKPSRGLVPMGPDPLESPGGTTTSGFTSISVRDNAAMLDAVSAPMTGALYPAVNQGVSLLAQLEEAPKGLKIGLIRRPLAEIEPDPEVIAAVEETAALCEELGHHVVEVELPIDHAATLERIWLHWAVSIGTAIHRIDQRRGVPGAIADAGRYVQLLWEKSRAVTAPDYLANLNRLQVTCGQVAQWQEAQGLEVLLSPMAAGAPPRLGWLNAETDDPETVHIRQRDYFSYTPLMNHMGAPGMSVPLGWSRSGLPLGSHFFAAQGQDGLLLRLARQLEIARPWRDRLPGIC